MCLILSPPDSPTFRMNTVVELQTLIISGFELYLIFHCPAIREEASLNLVSNNQISIMQRIFLLGQY